MRLSVAPPPKVPCIQRGPSAGDSPPGKPITKHTVKSILREFDRAAYGEAFRGDRLVKLSVLGKGEHVFVSRWWPVFVLFLAKY